MNVSGCKNREEEDMSNLRKLLLPVLCKLIVGKFKLEIDCGIIILE